MMTFEDNPKYDKWLYAVMSVIVLYIVVKTIIDLKTGYL